MSNNLIDIQKCKQSAICGQEMNNFFLKKTETGNSLGSVKKNTGAETEQQLHKHIHAWL
jgi:hypothetical protein